MDSRATVFAVFVAAVLAAGAGAMLIFGDSEPEQVTVSVSGSAGIGSVEGAGVYESGEQVTVRASVQQWYVFDGWFDGSGNLLSPDAEYTFSAKHIELHPRAHTEKQVTVSVTSDGGVESVTGAGTYLLDSEVILRVDLKPGYRFVGWFGPKGFITENARLSVTASDVTLEARTAQKGRVNLTLEGDPGVASVSGGGSYVPDSVTTISAELKPGYSFVGWYYDSGFIFSEKQTQDVMIKDRSTRLVAVTEQEYTISVLGMPAVNHSGAGTYRDLAKTELRAFGCNGNNFLGWYDLDGNAISYDTVLDPGMSDRVVVARTNTDCYAGANALSVTSFPEWYDSSCYCIVTESFSDSLITVSKGTEPVSLSLTDGHYEVWFYNGLFDGSAQYTGNVYDLGEDVKQFYFWKHGGEQYDMVLTLKEETLKSYYSKFLDRSPQPIKSRMREYGQPDGVIDVVADYMTQITQGMTQVETASLVLSFVQQCFDYQLDSDYNGRDEYWKLPGETLLDKRGDCEDTSALFISIMKAMGYDTAFLMFPGHMAGGVVLPSVPGGTYFSYGGSDYYYCETTAMGWSPGESPEGYDTAIMVIVI